jgi:hypothetical protein
VAGSRGADEVRELIILHVYDHCPCVRLHLRKRPLRGSGAVRRTRIGGRTVNVRKRVLGSEIDLLLAHNVCKHDFLSTIGLRMRVYGCDVTPAVTACRDLVLQTFPESGYLILVVVVRRANAVRIVAMLWRYRHV